MTSSDRRSLGRLNVSTTEDLSTIEFRFRRRRRLRRGHGLITGFGYEILNPALPDAQLTVSAPGQKSDPY
jgi:hypothetical protein